MSGKPRRKKGKAQNSPPVIQPSLPTVPERKAAPPSDAERLDGGTRAANFSILGGVLLVAAQWLHSGEGKGVTGTPQVNNALAAFSLVAGLALFLPITSRVLQDIREERPRAWGYVVAAIALLLTGSAMGSFVSSLTSSETPPQKPFPSAVVMPLELTVRSGLPAVRPDAHLKVRVGVQNKGPGIARGVSWISKIQIIRTPDTLAQEGRVLQDVFADMRFPSDRTRDMVSGNTTYTEIGFRKEALAKDIDEIKSGEKRIYVISRAKWTDDTGDHESATCFYLRPPGTDPVWRICGGFNFIS